MATESWRDTYATIIVEEQLEYMLDTIYSLTSLEKQMVSERQAFYFLSNAKSLLGFAAITKSINDNTIFKLNKFYLQPTFKGMGYGKIFMELLIGQMRLEGGASVILNVNRSNPAIHFYKKAGFEIIAEEDVPIGNYWMNDYVMKKWIMI